MGSRDGCDALEKAEAVVKNYDEECKKKTPLPEGRNYAKIAQSPEGETVVVVCNPFMHRVHEHLPQSGDLVFIDATSNLDRNDTKLLHMVCSSPIGALPLAEIITTREDDKTLRFAFELLKSVLPEKAFYGRGWDLGPKIMMTDDSGKGQIIKGAVFELLTGLHTHYYSKMVTFLVVH